MSPTQHAKGFPKILLGDTNRRDLQQASLNWNFTICASNMDLSRMKCENEVAKKCLYFLYRFSYFLGDEARL